MTAVRRCRVNVTLSDGVTHAVEVQGSSVFEVAAAGLAEFRKDGWIEPLGATAIIRVEVQPPPVIHDVPLKALERWARGPSISPKQELLSGIEVVTVVRQHAELSGMRLAALTAGRARSSARKRGRQASSTT